MALLRLVPILSKAGLSTVLQRKFLDAREIFLMPRQETVPHRPEKRKKGQEYLWPVKSLNELTQYLSFL